MAVFSKGLLLILFVSIAACSGEGPELVEVCPDQYTRSDLYGSPSVTDHEAGAYDVVVVGAGLGGVTAALQAARLGASVALVEETDWIGGQLTAAAVTPLDEGGFNHDAGIYIEFIHKIIDHYDSQAKMTETWGIARDLRSVEPSVAQMLLLEMIDAEPNIELFRRTRILSVLHELDDGRQKLTGIETVRDSSGATESLTFRSAVVIDSTEYGDVIGMSPAKYRVGNTTDDLLESNRCVDDATYVAVIKRYPDGVPPGLVLTTPPPGYEKNVARFKSVVAAGGHDWRNTGWGVYPVNWQTHVAYRSMQDSSSDTNNQNQQFENITKSGVNWANDTEYNVGAIEDLEIRQKTNCEAKMRTLQFLYYVQNELGQSDWSIANDEGFDTEYNIEKNLCDLIPGEYKEIEKYFPVMPYVRESRRLVGMYTLTASDIRREGSPPKSPNLFETSVAVGDYAVDRHGCAGDVNLELSLESSADVPSPSVAGAFQIPFGVFIPESVDGLVAAEKNLSLSRLASGATRTQPAVMHTGQAAGAIAALAALDGIQPRMVNPILVQRELTRAGTRVSSDKFFDVGRCSNQLWPDVELATGRGILSGFGNHNFGAKNALSRSQAAVMLDKLFEFSTSSGSNSPRFADVTSEHKARTSIEAVYEAGVMSECNAAPLRFCPDEPVTRAEAVVMIIDGLGLDPGTASSDPRYDDVASDHGAFTYIQLANDNGLIAPCDTASLNFCPDEYLSREDAASIASRSLLVRH